MRKLFTLIELIIVIVVLGVLAAIVIPNINKTKDKAHMVSAEINYKEIQTAVDLFNLENNGGILTYTKSTEGQPEFIDRTKLEPNFVRNFPDDTYFWIDFNGTIWFSTVDSPTGLKNKDGVLSWNNSEGAKVYNIYKLEANSSVGGNVGSVGEKRNLYRLIDSIEENKINVENDEDYLISAVDKYGFESPPVSGSYYGIPEGKRSMRFHKKSWIDDFGNYTSDYKTQNAILLPDLEDEELDALSGEGWVYWDGDVTDHTASGIWGAHPVKTKAYHLEVMHNARNERNGEKGTLRLRINEFILEVNNVMPAKEWTHIAFSYDKNEGDEGVGSLYVNGKLVGVQDSPSSSINLSGLTYHSLGDSRFFKKDNQFRPFYGEIKEFRLWNKLLNEEDISKHLNKSFTGKEDNLIGYWKTNNIKGSTVLDLSPNNYHGKINGSPILLE